MTNDEINCGGKQNSTKIIDTIKQRAIDKPIHCKRKHKKNNNRYLKLQPKPSTSELFTNQHVTEENIDTTNLRNAKL